MSDKKVAGIKVWETLAVLLAIAVLSTVAALPKFKTEVIGSKETAGASEEGVSPGEAAEGVGSEAVASGGTGTSSKAGGAAGAQCAAGKNGGATDVGVSATSIKLGATVVDSGTGSAFLSDVRHGMRAVLNEVNAAGGICGRKLDLVLKDDGWQAQRGFEFIRNLVEDEKVFALAVVPSSEGLHVASSQGYLRKQKIPVIGTDGMLVSQYIDPTIWPVASATISAMHIMAKHAYDRGVRKFSIVYDLNYRFGLEGAYAFNEAVKRLTGEGIAGYSDPLKSPRCEQRFCAIKAGQESYGTELQKFKSSCQTAPECEYIAYLLEPETAQKWMSQGGIGSGYINNTPVKIGGPQPLFNRGFGVNCAQSCHDMEVWTGFKPPIEAFANEPQIAKYVSDVQQTDKGADVYNSFVEGGYVGMKVLVEALKKLGPVVTRDGLRQTIDSETFDFGFSKPLTFKAGNHFANQCMLSFTIQSRPSFAGWRQDTPDWICDPWPGEDIPPDLL